MTRAVRCGVLLAIVKDGVWWGYCCGRARFGFQTACKKEIKNELQVLRESNQFREREREMDLRPVKLSVEGGNIVRGISFGAKFSNL